MASKRVKDKKRKLAEKARAKKLPSKKELDKKMKKRLNEIKKEQEKMKKKFAKEKKGGFNSSKARRMSSKKEGVKKPKEMKDEVVKKRAEKRLKKLREKSKDKIKNLNKKEGVIAVLPSPYKGEEIVLRKREVADHVEIEAMRKKGKEEEKIGFIGARESKEMGEKIIEIPSMRVAREYRKAGIGTALDSALQLEIEKKKGKVDYSIQPAGREGKKFWEKRRKRGKEFEIKNKDKKIDTKSSLKEIKKARDPIKKASKLVEEGKIQKRNYKEVSEKLKKEGNTIIAKEIETIIEKHPAI